MGDAPGAPRVGRAHRLTRNTRVWDGEWFTRNGTEWRRCGFAHPIVGPERSLGKQVGHVYGAGL
jgi:hypothetical protein